MGKGVQLVIAEFVDGLLYFKDLAGNTLLKLAAGASVFIGDLTGAVQHTVEAGAASGAVAVASKDVFITAAGAAALTLADPTATTHDGIRIRFVATTAQAHTLDNSAGSGFNGGGAGSDVGTFGGAVGDRIEVVAYQGVWYVTDNLNVTLA